MFRRFLAMIVSAWRTRDVFVWRNNAARQWFIFFSNDEMQIEQPSIIRVRLMRSRESGRIVGLVINDEDLESP